MPFSALIQTSELGAARIIGPRTPARICTRHGFPGRATSAGRRNCTASGRGFASLAGNSKPSQLISSFFALTAPKFLTHQAMSSTGRYTMRMKGTCAHQMFLADIEDLYHGNKQYMARMSQTRPGLLASLALEGQKPPFMLVDCSDSRVNEQEIFSAQPGTMFTAGNIANRFDENDINSNAVLSFAVETLKVQHVVVMGHYGCGGVAESMRNLEQPILPKDVPVQSWIHPIREIYRTSMRPEIVAHRDRHRLEPLKSLPDLHDPAFRALVEENVKSNVHKIANSAVIKGHYENVVSTNGSAPASAASADEPSPFPPVIAKGTTGTPITEVFIHGWVYDVENGKVSDLGVSVGPPGRVVPTSPFPLLRA